MKNFPQKSENSMNQNQQQASEITDDYSNYDRIEDDEQLRKEIDDEILAE